jgi:hypothetical protein
MGRQNIMDRPAAGIPHIHCAMHVSIHIILISWCRPQILNVAIFSNILLSLLCHSGPGSSVGIATGYGLDGPWFESSSPATAVR